MRDVPPETRLLFLEFLCCAAADSALSLPVDTILLFLRSPLPLLLSLTLQFLFLFIAQLPHTVLCT